MFPATVVVFLTAATWTFSAAAGSGDHRGRSFMVAMPNTYAWQDAQVRVVITAEITSQVRLVAPSLGLDKTVLVTAMTSHHEIINNDIIVRSNLEVQSKGLWIGASEEVSVYCYQLEEFTSDSFLALPVSSLGVHYVVATYAVYSTFSPQLVVAAVENGTEVEITLHTSGRVTCGSNSHYSGSKFTFTLNKYDVVRLGCSEDITGSEVTATKPVAVLSGNECAQVPIGVKFCDLLVEMVPPTSALGLKYVLSYIQGRRSGSIHRVVAAESGTTTVRYGSTTRTLLKSEHLDVGLQHGERECLTADRPVLVVRLSKSKENDPSYAAIGDPFMMVLPPIARFAGGYFLDTTVTSSNQAVSHYLEVVVPDHVTWTSSHVNATVALPECGVKVGSSQVSSGHLELSVANGSVGLLQYALIEREAYGHPAGYLLDNFSGANECDARPCLNGGTCYETGTSYECLCPSPGLGPNCEDGSTTSSAVSESAMTSSVSSTPTLPVTVTDLTTSALATVPSSTLSSQTSSSSVSSSSSTEFYASSPLETSSSRLLSTSTATSSSLLVVSSVDIYSSSESSAETSTPAWNTATSTLSTVADVETSTHQLSSVVSTSPVVAPTTVSDVSSRAVTSSTVTEAPTTELATQRPSTPGQCSCRCRVAGEPPGVEAAQLEAMAVARNLTVPLSMTSRYQRTKISVPDTRRSSTLIGVVGVLVLVFVFGSLIALDAVPLIVRGVRMAKSLWKAK